MSGSLRIGKIPPDQRRLFELEFERLRAETQRYGDASARFEDFRIWREHKRDEPADVQFVWRILEQMPDVDECLREIRHLSRKMALFYIDIDPLRDAEYWKKKIGEHFQVLHCEQLNLEVIVILGAILMKVPQMPVVAAGTDEKRWQQIVENSKRITTRAHKLPAHGRRAILVCYGPSLNDWLDHLRENALDPCADVISVSGAHDWLISHGITPKVHIECDPRPHKAKNIARPIPGVRYEIASVASPVLFDKLSGGDVVLWHTSTEHNFKVIELEPDAWFAGNGGNVGLRAIGYKYDQGYREFDIYGMDCSLSPTDGYQWAGPHASKEVVREHPVKDACCQGQWFKTTDVLISYAASFFDVMRALPDATYRHYSNGLLKAMAKLYVETPFTEIPFIQQDEVANVLHR